MFDNEIETKFEAEKVNEKGEIEKITCSCVDVSKIKDPKNKKADIEGFFPESLLCEARLNGEAKLSGSFANYQRYLSKINPDYLSHGSSGWHWRYLVQVEHIRWCRHQIMYGTLYTKEYFKVIPDKKYWKDYLKLHTCLLPYSSYDDFNKKLTEENKKCGYADYLPYSDEDYDYVMIFESLKMSTEF